MRKVILFALFITFNLLYLAGSAQDSTFLSRAVTKLGQQPAQEKVYLHLDKPNYGYGDTIWYKAYTVVGQKHQLSALSGVLYVELLSTKDSLVTRQAVPMVSGVGWSDMPLAHSLRQGIYRIRAYTRWMQNLGPDYFYDQKIRLGGIAPATVQQAVKENPDVQFFPEGGELVNGVRSRVAIKAVGENGLGEDIKGTIEDNNGTIVADFSTRHLGMGLFVLMPEAGKTYKAKINVAGEATYSIDLPKAKETGYTLAINNSAKDSVFIKIATNEQTLNIDKDKTFFIIAQSSGKIYYTTQGKLEGMAYMARVEKSRFPEGIVQFTLFNQGGEPLAERIVFIDNPKSELNLDINSSAQTYTTRDKVKLTLTAKGDSSKTVSGSFSVSVINESKVLPDENAESTIENNLLLTSELKGYIEQPNYYFANKSEQTKADLDVLMLTQGYRRFEWQDVLNDKLQILAYKPQLTQELSGILTTPAGKPVPNGKVTLAAVKQDLFRDTTADADGKFTFTNLAFTDTAALVIKARKSNNGSNVIIKALLPDYPKITPAENITETASIDTARQPLPKQQFTDYQKQQTDESLKNGKTLNTVTITGFKMPPKPDMSKSSNLHGGGNADRVIMGKDLGHCVNLADCLGDKLIGIPGYNGMSVIVDGINLGKGHLNDINPNDVYSVEVLYHLFAKAIYGSSIEKAGAIIITLKNGGEETSKTKPIETAGQLQYSQYEQDQKSDSLKNGKTLKTVNIRGIKRPKQPDLSNSSNLNGPGHANQVIMYDQLGTCANLTDCLVGHVFGVKFSPSGKASSTRAGGGVGGMRIIVDGILLDPKMASLNDINPNDVYSIEVLRSGAYLAIYGSNAPGGALVITMKRGGEGTADIKHMETAGQLQYSQYEKQQKEDSLKNGKTLKTVNIKGIKHPKKPDLTFSANLNGPGHADQVVMYDQLNDCVNLSDCLIGRLAGVKIEIPPGAVHAGVPYLMRAQNKLGGATPMVVIVDGIIMGGGHLDDLNPSDIYSIEVLRSGAYLAIYGSNAPAGALVITTKRGGEGTANIKPMETAGQLQYSQYEKDQKSDSLKNGKTLKTVNIKGIKHPKKPDLTFSSNLNGPGHANQVIMYDKLGDCINLADCLNGRVFGVTFNGGKATNTRVMNKMVNGPPPAMRIIVDGVMLDPQTGSLNDLNPNDIYSIEVLRSGAYLAIYGSNAPGGALVITSKRGGEGTAYFTQAAPNGIMTFPFPGFYKAKAFYTPKYEHKADKQLPDNRTTIYWNPNILTDKDGKASIEYFNNDTRGTYRVVVEGIDDDGNLGRAVYRYKVE